MKILIEKIKETEVVLHSLEDILKQEYDNLSNSKTSHENLLLCIEKKTALFKKLVALSQERSFIEKKIDMVEPYQNNYELSNYWNKILKKCILLKKLNLKNKILLNKKFYLNQHFLELLPSYKKNMTYNLDGNLKN